jgi:hypothetical protein
VKPTLHLLVATLFALGSVSGSIIEQGSGIVYGEDHVFKLTAPSGWVLDNESAVRQGVHAVLYPKGSTWKDSVVVAYARSRPKTDKIRTAEDAANFVVDDFRANGSPNYRCERMKTIKTASGLEAVIYNFSGDQWGNTEAAAYFVEAKTINFVILNSRDRKAFADALPAFEQLARSYVFVGDAPLQHGSDAQKTFDDIRARAERMAATEPGKAYEKEFSRAFAESARAALQSCTRETKPPYVLNLVFPIDADGKVRHVFSAPDQSVSACVAEKLNNISVPVPPKLNWLVGVNVTVNE